MSARNGHKMIALSGTTEELERLKKRAAEFRLPLSRFLILAGLSWDGKIKNE
ncbi:MAG: hypothetical protein QW292_13690 [Candidatus Parvarchaeota archaeon]